MRLLIGMLLGGYAFIVLSYAFVWAIAAGMARHLSAERMDRSTKDDVKAVMGMMVAWSVACAVIAVVEVLH